MWAIRIRKGKFRSIQQKEYKKKYWVIPSESDANFVAPMEDVLYVYTLPSDLTRPVVCLDETSKQLTQETRTPLPHGPGRGARFDYEYERAGVASLLIPSSALSCNK